MKAKSNSLTLSDLKRLEDKTDMEASVEQVRTPSRALAAGSISYALRTPLSL